MNEDEKTAVPLAKLVKVYRKIRDEIGLLTQNYERELGRLEEAKREVSNEIKEMMRASGQKSAGTEHGTVSLSTRTRYTTNDWDSFKKFVLQYEVVELLEQRIAQTNMKQFLSDNPGVVPPGLNAETEYTVTVRKPST